MAPRAKARALVVLVLLDAAEPRRAVERAHRRMPWPLAKKLTQTAKKLDSAPKSPPPPV